MPKYILSKAVGIDLGTTNSAVAIMTPTDTQIVIHSDPKSKKETTPSCVWKDPKTGQVVVGSKAFSRLGSRPVPIRSIKRSMGRAVKVPLTNEQVTPQQVSAYILSEMRRQIEEDVRSQSFETDSTAWVVDRAIVTVPAYFDQPQIDATRKAAELAGLQVLELLHEPTAAACYHCWQASIQDGVFLVYDFGGGTFDVSVLRCTGGAFEVLGISGNNHLGGDDIDAALAEEIQQRLLTQDYDLHLDVKNDAEDSLRFDKLKFLAEGVKKALSSANEYVLRDTTSLQDKAGSWVEIDMMFERDEVESIIRPIVERTIPYCFQAIELAQKRAGITLSQIDAIILAGGTTHIPLVREIVQQALCSSSTAKGERAKCSEPVYRKVDTIVALGAAIRAAATGGLAVYNPERTVRVSFRGTGSTANRQTYVAGQVEALAPNIDLSGGQIRLKIADLGYEDEQPLKGGGAFSFTKVPLQPATENLLIFDIFSRNGARVATIGRPISQSKEAARPTGGSTGTANTSKAYYLEVSRAGKASRKELIPAMSTLPTTAKFQFFHPGSTDLLRLPLYQNKKKIQEIKVPVPINLAKGTPINFVINVDELSAISVSGSIQNTNRTFNAALEPPAERTMPTEHELQELDQTFHAVVTPLPPEQKTRIEDQYHQARNSYEAAMQRGNTESAVHDFEEMEELVESSKQEGGPLQPPKEFFDRLVYDCRELTELLLKVEQSPRTREIARSIEDQQANGDAAFTNNNQTEYADTIIKLNAIRDHLISLLVQLVDYEDTRSELERATDGIDFALEQANEADVLAQAAKRTDYQSEIDLLRIQLRQASQEVQRNPSAVLQKVVQIRQHIHQIRNVLVGLLKQSPDGKLLVSDE